MRWSRILLLVSIIVLVITVIVLSVNQVIIANRISKARNIHKQIEQEFNREKH